MSRTRTCTTEARQAGWKFDEAILTGIRAAPPAPATTNENPLGVRIDFAAWLGRKPSRAETVHLSRNLASLEARGLVLRLSFRRAALTEAGAVLARELDPLGRLDTSDLDSILREPASDALSAASNAPPRQGRRRIRPAALPDADAYDEAGSLRFGKRCANVSRERRCGLRCGIERQGRCRD